MIKCVVYRCPMKLRPFVFQQVAPQEPSQDKREYHGARHEQQLQFLGTGASYDAQWILAPLLIASTTPYPFSMMLLLHLVGSTGMLLMTMSSHLVNKFTRTSNLGLLDPINRLKLPITVVALTCTGIYWLFFALHYQRDLLKSLVTSFDFVFYSFQCTVLHISAAILDGWTTSYCLWLATSWFWTHWIYCLDTLMLVVKSKLWFHIRWAIPVIVLILIRELLLLSVIFVVGVSLSEDHSILRASIFGCSVQICCLSS